MSKKYDVIVIGAGPGGATCGALLAKMGLKVLLLEKNA
jgi:phytoene dehydrogenase-like protein